MARSGGRRRDTLARALALTWLAGPWTPRALAAAARSLLGEGARTPAPRLAARALEAFVRPPHGEPDQLARWLARRAVVRDALARRAPGTPLVPRWPTAPASPPPRLSQVAFPATVGELAAQLGVTPHALDVLADARRMGRSASPRQSHYRFTWLRKRSGGARLVEAPQPRLKAVQRAILDRFLAHAPLHDAAHGFVRGRSVHGFAAPHVGRALVVRFDLEDFFGSVHGGRVLGVLLRLGASREVAGQLARLTTTSTPSRVLRARPSTGETDADLFASRARLRSPHLPQGAPTSPALANLVAARLDARMAGLAASLGGVYGRYADDLVLSFGARTPSPDALAGLVRRIVTEEGFRLAEHKTRWMRPHQRQLVGGLVVNVRAQAPRADVDRLRAVLHRAATRGLPSLDLDVLPSRISTHLAGRAGWLSSGSPRRAAILAARLARVRG